MNIIYDKTNGKINGYEYTKSASPSIPMPDWLDKDKIHEYKVDLESLTVVKVSNDELLEMKREKLREKREIDIALVDKYQLVLRYNSLSDAQKLELESFREDLLNCTETLEYPNKPEWLTK
jgi:CTP synthase (UTP-ammonia lyase)